MGMGRGFVDLPSRRPTTLGQVMDAISDQFTPPRMPTQGAAGHSGEHPVIDRMDSAGSWVSAGSPDN